MRLGSLSSRISDNGREAIVVHGNGLAGNSCGAGGGGRGGGGGICNGLEISYRSGRSSIAVLPAQWPCLFHGRMQGIEETTLKQEV